MKFTDASPCGAIFLPVACAVMALSPASGMAQAPAAASAAEPPGLIASTWDRVSSTEAWKGPAHWRLAVSPFSHHWRYSEEHTNVYALGIERQYDDRWLLGGSLFQNSFGQPSSYVYIGKRVNEVFGQPPLFFQWSVGVMYGYVGKYKSKVPLNVGGFSPGALVSLGWQFNREWSATVHALGDAGVMLQFAYDFR